VPFTLVHAGKSGQKKLKTQKLNTAQKKQTTQNTAKQIYSGSVAFYDTRPGNEVGLFYNAAEPIHEALIHSSHSNYTGIATSHP